MLFFQGALLAGYGYAHLSLRRLGPRKQARPHGRDASAAGVLPITLREFRSPTAFAGPGGPVILALSVGAPYLVVSSTSPLVQRWFSVTGHPHASDPYFLYAAGNAGSVIGLLAYPLVVEPNLPIAAQGCCGRSAMSSSSSPASHARWCSGGGRRTGPPTPSNARPRQSHLRRAAAPPWVVWRSSRRACSRASTRADRHRRRSPLVGDPCRSTC